MVIRPNTLPKPSPAPYCAAVIKSRRTATNCAGGTTTFHPATAQGDELNAQSGTAARPVALFVIGFGRSGTSALTRVLSLCGAALPPRLLGANAHNRRGFWEPRAVIHLNEAILRRHRSSGYDLSLHAHEEGAFDVAANAAYIAKIRAYLATLPAAPLVVIKEPKLTALSGLWFEAARLAGFDIATVVAVRHPHEVTASLAKRRANNYNYVRDSPELTSAWWLTYTLLAERYTRGVPRVFVEYPNLLEDWRREVKRICVALAIDLKTRDEGAVDEFLTTDLRHHRDHGAVAEPFGSDWISTVYETLSAAARDEPWDESALDRVYEAYRASERGFRAAFEDCNRYRKLNRLIPLFLVKPSLEALALAHRRKGTWA